MTARLIPLANTPAADTLTTGAALGNEFHVTTGDQAATAIAWYRHTAGHAGPAKLRISNVTLNTELYSTDQVADDGSVGWHEQTIPAVILTQGAHYGVWGIFNNGSYYETFSPDVTPDSPIVLDGKKFGTNAAVHWSDLSSSASNEFAFGVRTDDTNVTPATLSDLQNQLTDWLADTGDNTHTAGDGVPGLPATTKDAVDALQTQANGATGFDAIKAVADAVAAAVSGLPGTIASAVTTITGQLTTLTGNTAQTGIATIGAISHDLAGVITHALDTFTGTGGGAPGALSGRTAFPTMLWTMADSVDFTFQKSWDVPADLYTITLSGIPSRINTVDVDGVTWRPRVGWWAIRNGDLFSRRDFLSWESNYVEDGGRRMPGIVVRTQPEITGTIEAWRLT